MLGLGQTISGRAPCKQWSDGEGPVRVAESESGKAERQDGMTQGCSKVLPEFRVRSGIVRGQQQNEHVNESPQARCANDNAKNKCQTDGKLPLGHEKCNRCGMRQDEVSEHGNHEGIRAVFQEAINPELKATPPA